MVDEKDMRIQELEELLDVKHDAYLQPFNLTQQQARLLALLMDVPIVTADTIERRIKMATEAKVAVHRLRSRLKKFGITISAARYRGFWLDPDQKELVKTFL